MLLLAACFGACACKSGTADIHDLYGMGAFKQHVSHRPQSTFETEHLFQARDDWRREREREGGRRRDVFVCVVLTRCSTWLFNCESHSLNVPALAADTASAEG